MAGGQFPGSPITYRATAAVSAYRRVTISADGLEVSHTGDSDPCDGVTLDNAALGALVSVKLKTADGTFEIEAHEAIAAGATLYPAAVGRVGDTKESGGERWKALEAATAQGDVIQVLFLPEGGASELIYSNVADSAEVENTTVETAFDKSKTIAGAGLKAGDVLEIMARAFVLDNNATDTLTLKLKVGTEEIVATPAVDVADSDVGYIHAFVTVRDVGVSGALAASGVVALGVPGTVTAKPFRKDEAAEDLSGDVAITVTATWSVAHADNEVLLENLIVITHRA